MSYYTAKQIVDVLQNEGISMPLRKVRYYTQIGLIPPSTQSKRNGAIARNICSISERF